MPASFDLRRVTARGVRTLRTSSAFELTLLVDKKPLLFVQNRGDGGSHLYVPAKEADPKEAWAMKRTLEAAAAAAIGERFEPLDALCSAFADGAKNGEEAVAIWRGFKAQYDRVYDVAKPSLQGLIAAARKKKP